jgi:hypothetical protein
MPRSMMIAPTIMNFSITPTDNYLQDSVSIDLRNDPALTRQKAIALKGGRFGLSHGAGDGGGSRQECQNSYPDRG